jgi:Protein of unknown function (DUF2905)
MDRGHMAEANPYVESEPGRAMAPLGKSLVMLGLMVALVGAAIWAAGSIPGVGRLPGDIYVRRGNFTLYLPLATCIVLSIVATIVLSLMRR